MEWVFLVYLYQKKCNGKSSKYIFSFINIDLFLLRINIILQNQILKKNFNRNNINEIINKKISNLPILKNDTNNAVEFNDGFSNDIKNEKPRSFWNLLQPE